MLFILSLMLISTVSFGQSIPSGTARYEALGYNPFIKDAAIDINRNPAWATKYKNYAFGDIGKDVVNDFQLKEQYAGINFYMLKNMSIGLVLNKFEDSFADTTFLGEANSKGVERPVVPLKLLYGWEVSPKVALGIAPYYSAWSKESGDSNYSKWNSRVLGGTAGILLNTNVGWIEASADVKTHKYKKDETIGNNNTINENFGGMSLNGYARAFFTASKSMNINIVPYVQFGMFNWEPRTTPAPANDDVSFSNMKLTAGCGVNMPIFDDAMFAGGVSFDYISNKKEHPSVNVTNTTSRFILPRFNIGIEWPFLNWLTGRMGYSRSVMSHKDETQSVKTTYTTVTEVSDAKQTITLGIGLHFNRFSLDLTVADKFLHEGIYFINGQSSAIFGALSASYNFAK